jgi:hypothetical protein
LLRILKFFSPACYWIYYLLAFCASNEYKVRISQISSRFISTATNQNSRKFCTQLKHKIVAGHFSCTFAVILVFCCHREVTILKPVVKFALHRDHAKTHHYDLQHHHSKMASFSPSVSLSRHIEPAPKHSFWTIVEVSCFSDKAHCKRELRNVSYTAYSCLHTEHHCIYSKEMGKCFIMLFRIEWLGRAEVLANALIIYIYIYIYVCVCVCVCMYVCLYVVQR